MLNALLFIHLWEVPPWSSGSVLDHRSLPPVFESRHGHIWRAFHVWLHFITFGGRSAHLAYHVHKSGCKTSIIIINHSSVELIKSNKIGEKLCYEGYMYTKNAKTGAYWSFIRNHCQTMFIIQQLTAVRKKLYRYCIYHISSFVILSSVIVVVGIFSYERLFCALYLRN